MTSTPQPADDLEEILKKYCHTDHSGGGVICTSFHQQELHYLIRELTARDARRDRKAEGIGSYLTASLLSHHVGYLLAHRAQGGLPEMTAQVIGELWENIKSIQKENEQYMRKQQLTPNKDKSDAHQ